MLQFHAVHMNRPGLTLREIDLTLEPGSALLLSGATGSGKSTLLQLGYGGILADAGRVEVFGRNIARLRRSSIALLRRHIGIVPQTLELLEARTVSDNVALPLTIRALERKQIHARVADTLARVGIAELGERRVTSLSQGERQLVAIARALVISPDLIIADEPTAYLDQHARDAVMTAIVRACEHGCAALIATNDHKLLSAGALVGWNHAEIVGHALELIAERSPFPESLDVEDYYEEYSCEPAEDLRDECNVVPFPLRVAYAGGLVK